MSRYKLLFFILLAAFVSSGCAGTGSDIYNITGTTFAGDNYELLDDSQRPLILNFWYPSCPPCVVELPDFQRAYEQYGDRVDFLAVFSPIIDSEERAREFIAELGVEFPVLTDSDTNAQFEYGVTAYPTTFYINAERNSARRHVGGPIPYASLESSILDLLNE